MLRFIIISEVVNMTDFSNYGQERDVHANDDELEIFLTLKTIMSDHGLDPFQLELVRRSDNYVTAAIGGTDVARFKFTPRARWILFPYSYNDKIHLETPDTVSEFSEAVIQAVRIADEINSSDN